MGIASAIQRNCFQSQDEEGRAGFLDSHGRQINDDYAFFQNEYWYRLQQNLLFDPNKFIFLSSNYKQRQLQLVQRWKIVDSKKIRNNDRINFSDTCLMDKWKFAIRKGIPIIYYKNIIEMLFAKNFGLDQASKRYQALLFQALKKTNNKLQLITFKEESVEAYASPFLNREGVIAAKRIAFLISKTLNQVESNPYIISVISLLLIFVSQADTYDIIYSMIDGSTSMSVDRQDSLRWHFSLSESQMEKFAREFFKTVKKVSPSINAINDHLNTEGIDKFFIFKDIIGNFFFGFVPFPVVCQTITGARIFYRFLYAILKLAGPSIRQSTNTQQILRVIRAKLLVSLCNDEQVKQFFRLAYDLRLQNLVDMKKNEKGMLQSKRSTEQIIYYLPILSGASQILSFQDLQQIWDFLPNIIKHYDAKKIFPTPYSGSTFNDMMSSIQKQTLTLLIIQCTNENVFGVFLAERIKTTKQIQQLQKIKSPPNSGPIERLTGSESSTKLNRILSSREESQKKFSYFGSSESFVFTLAPKKQKFSSTGQNIFYCAFNNTSFIVGGPSSNPAILIQQNLTLGSSYPCPTYANEPLHQGPPGEFKIKKIECFAIQ